ncbi:MAG: serine hydrolase [Sphaerospermopsis kisseleviana]
MNNKTRIKKYKINKKVFLKRLIFLFLLPISLLIIIVNKLIANQSEKSLPTVQLDVTSNPSISGKNEISAPFSKSQIPVYLSKENITEKTIEKTTEKTEQMSTTSPLIMENTIQFTPPSIGLNETRLIQPDDYNLENLPNKYASLVYNVKSPEFKSNENLDNIVNQIVNYVENKGLPSDKLSVSLLQINEPEFPTYSGHLPTKPRFTASVVKLFWMVYLYGNYNSNKLQRGIISDKDVKKMIQDSDNESSSVIVDKISETTSGESLSEEELKNWIQKRLAMNLFFQNAGYTINISQKVFPTSYQKNDSPVGRDLQIRSSKTNLIRNYTTSYDVARLLYEIYTEKSISKQYSREMKNLMKRDLAPAAWKNKQFNAIEGFLGQGLPENVEFYSKMGWNSKTRNDAAIIISPDGKCKYILVVFGDDPSFFQDKTLFPEISRLVYEKMLNSPNTISELNP